MMYWFAKKLAKLVLHCLAMFRAAAEAQDEDILKMYNTRGSLICVGPSLPANSPDMRYKLEVITANTSGNITCCDVNRMLCGM